MHTGTVVWFSPGKGYGFVADENTHSEYFCHFSSINMDGYKSLNQGDRISFDVELGPKGKPQAVDVRVIGRAKVA